MSLSCRITWTLYAGKENIEDSWPDIISTGDLDSLHNTTLLETSITFPAAPLCSYTAPLACDHGKIHWHHVCSLRQYSPTQVWARFSSLLQSCIFHTFHLLFLHEEGYWALVTVFYTHGTFPAVSVKLEKANINEIKYPYFYLSAGTLNSVRTLYAESFTKKYSGIPSLWIKYFHIFLGCFFLPQAIKNSNVQIKKKKWADMKEATASELA